MGALSFRLTNDSICCSFLGVLTIYMLMVLIFNIISLLVCYYYPMFKKFMMSVLNSEDGIMEECYKRWNNLDTPMSQLLRNSLREFLLYVKGKVINFVLSLMTSMMFKKNLKNFSFLNTLMLFSLCVGFCFSMALDMEAFTQFMNEAKELPMIGSLCLCFLMLALHVNSMWSALMYLLLWCTWIFALIYTPYCILECFVDSDYYSLKSMMRMWLVLVMVSLCFFSYMTDVSFLF